MRWLIFDRLLQKIQQMLVEAAPEIFKFSLLSLIFILNFTFNTFMLKAILQVTNTNFRILQVTNTNFQKRSAQYLGLQYFCRIQIGESNKKVVKLVSLFPPIGLSSHTSWHPSYFFPFPPNYTPAAKAASIKQTQFHFHPVNQTNNHPPASQPTNHQAATKPFYSRLQCVIVIRER